jgi:hypothetical protein
MPYYPQSTLTLNGTLNLGGFTLTVPATGTTALLGEANVFTAAQTIYDSGSALGLTLAGAAGGGTVTITATSPAQVASATVGTPLSITASPAIAGASNAGAAAGGNITLTAGAAARLTSGNAAGGNIRLAPGAGIGTGEAGYVHVGSNTTTAAGLFGFMTFGSSNTGFGNSGNNTLQLYTNQAQGGIFNFSSTAGLTTGSGLKIGWASVTGGSSTITQDTALSRNAAAIVEVNNGTAGQWGALKAGTRDAGTTTIVDGLTLGHQSSGTPDVGLGTGLMLNINSTTTADQNALRLTAEWVVATHASRTARAKFQVYDTAAREALRLEASGSAAMLGFLGASAVAKQTVTGFRAGAGAATASFLTAVANFGFITDSSTAGGPGCRVYNSGAITIANNTTTALTFDTERYDTDTMHSTSSNTSRITATTAGKYLIGGCVRFASNSTGARYLFVVLNGTTNIVASSMAADANHYPDLNVSTVYDLAANDYIELAVNQSSGGNLDVSVNGNTSPEFWAQQIG